MVLKEKKKGILHQSTSSSTRRNQDDTMTRRLYALSLLLFASSIQFAQSLKLEHHPDRVHLGRDQPWTAADERALRKQTMGTSSAKNGGTKSGNKGKGSSIPEPEFCRNCAFASSYNVSSAIQVVNGELLDSDQIIGEDSTEAALAMCDSCGCNSENPGLQVVMSLQGECDQEAGVDLLQVIITQTNPDEDGYIEMSCPDLTYDIDVECRAFTLGQPSTEIVPVPIDIVLHYGPIITIQTLDRSANYFCNFICVDVGLRRDTPVAVPPRPPPTPAPVLIPATPAPVTCQDVTSDGTFFLPHAAFFLDPGSPVTIPPDGCIWDASQQSSIAVTFCVGAGQGFTTGTFVSSVGDPCQGASVAGNAFFRFFNTGSTQSTMAQFNTQFMANCCS